MQVSKYEYPESRAALLSPHNANAQSLHGRSRSASIR